MAFGAELATFVDILDFYLSDKRNESRRELLESGGPGHVRTTDV